MGLLSGMMRKRGFDPLAIPGLAHYWRADASSLTLDGTDVDAIADQKGGMSLANATNPPTYVASSSAFNNKPIIRFTNTDTTALAGTVPATLSQPYTILMVAEYTGASPLPGVFRQLYDTSFSRVIYSLGTTSQINFGASATFIAEAGQVANLTTPFSSIGEYSAADANLWTRGVQIIDGGTIGNQNWASGQTFVVGCLNSAPTGDATSSVDMDLAELAIVDGLLSTATKNAYLAYVQSRYGISYTAIS